MIRTKRPILVLFVAWCAALLVGCGAAAPTKTTKKEPSMTPDQASSAMAKGMETVTAALSPDGRAKLSKISQPIPCGGPEGSDFDKVKTTMLGRTGAPVDDVDAALRRAKAKAEEAGLKVRMLDPDSGLTSRMAVSDDGWGAMVLLVDGSLEVDGETHCLDNPDR